MVGSSRDGPGRVQSGPIWGDEWALRNPAARHFSLLFHPRLPQIQKRCLFGLPRQPASYLPKSIFVMKVPALILEIASLP